ncbi:MAG: ATP-grasp domain-containing protein [Patescibacteria group bacterium]
MVLHEYEGKKLFEKYGILVPRGVLILKGEDAGKAYRTLDRWQTVLKGQTHERGRMEKGLVRFCSSEDEVLAAVKNMWALGVGAVLIEEKLEVAEERELSIAHDENLGQPVLEYGPRGADKERHVLDIHADADLPSAGFPHIPYSQAFWNLYRREKASVVAAKPLGRIPDSSWVALDVRVALEE